MSMEIWIKLKLSNSVLLVEVNPEWTKLIISWDHPAPDLSVMDGIVVWNVEVRIGGLKQSNQA